MSDDLLTSLQLLRVQKSLDDAARLSATNNRIAADTLEELRKKKDVPVPIPLPQPKKFNLVALKQELALILSGDDALKLPELKAFGVRLKNECDRHATEITNYLDREITAMAHEIRAKTQEWEPQYAERAAQNRLAVADAKRRRDAAAAAAAAKRRPEEIRGLQEFLDLDQAMDIERPLMPQIIRTTWSFWLGLYLLVTSVFPIDVYFARLIIGDIFNWGYYETFGLAFGMWLAKILIIWPIVIAGNPDRREKRAINRYLDLRAKAFAQAGLPEHLLNLSYNGHCDAAAALKKKFGIANARLARIQLDMLQRAEG